MQIGEVCDLAIDGIGTLSNPIVAAAHTAASAKPAAQAPVRRAV
jgi:hypothetical protein